MKPLYDTFMDIFEKRELGIQRQQLIPTAKGKVLEIGSGTGVNLKFYDFQNMESLVLTDYNLNPVLSDKVKSLAHDTVDLKSVDVESLPFEDSSFDTVVVTLVFCSVFDVLKGLSEIKRVLKDDGQYIFIEHVLPEKKPLKEIFNAVTPVWKVIASNCHLNRDFLEYLNKSGYQYELNKRFFKTAFVSGVAKINN